MSTTLTKCHSIIKSYNKKDLVDKEEREKFLDSLKGLITRVDAEIWSFRATVINKIYNDFPEGTCPSNKVMAKLFGIEESTYRKSWLPKLGIEKPSYVVGSNGVTQKGKKGNQEQNAPTPDNDGQAGSANELEEPAVPAENEVQLVRENPEPKDEEDSSEVENSVTIQTSLTEVSLDKLKLQSSFTGVDFPEDSRIELDLGSKDSDGPILTIRIYSGENQGGPISNDSLIAESPPVEDQDNEKGISENASITTSDSNPDTEQHSSEPIIEEPANISDETSENGTQAPNSVGNGGGLTEEDSNPDVKKNPSTSNAATTVLDEWFSPKRIMRVAKAKDFKIQEFEKSSESLGVLWGDGSTLVFDEQRLSESASKQYGRELEKHEVINILRKASMSYSEGSLEKLKITNCLKVRIGKLEPPYRDQINKLKEEIMS